MLWTTLSLPDTLAVRHNLVRTLHDLLTTWVRTALNLAPDTTRAVLLNVLRGRAGAAHAGSPVLPSPVSAASRAGHGGHGGSGPGAPTPRGRRTARLLAQLAQPAYPGGRRLAAGLAAAYAGHQLPGLGAELPYSRSDMLLFALGSLDVRPPLESASVGVGSGSGGPGGAQHGGRVPGAGGAAAPVSGAGGLLPGGPAAAPGLAQGPVAHALSASTHDLDAGAQAATDPVRGPGWGRGPGAQWRCGRWRWRWWRRRRDPGRASGRAPCGR